VAKRSGGGCGWMEEEEGEGGESNPIKCVIILCKSKVIYCWRRSIVALWTICCFYAQKVMVR
jgi:hypothetical protein